MHGRIEGGATMLPSPPMEIQLWPIDRLIFYVRNPRKNDSTVDRMGASIREFGFKIPVLAHSDGEVVDGHLRLKAARKMGITEVPVILCDECTPAQVKAFRLMVNCSVEWAVWDEELRALEPQELKESDFDLSLTASTPVRSMACWHSETMREPMPRHRCLRTRFRESNLWACGKHRVLCGDATSAAAVSRLLGERKPR